MKRARPNLWHFLTLLQIGIFTCLASPALSDVRQGSITDRSISWPSWADWSRLLLLEDYNTRVVVLGTTVLGAVAGLLGSFTLLRKRALMGDALSHATLPGIALAFIIATNLGVPGKSLPILLLGAVISGCAGIAAILFIRNYTRLKEDTALGVVLSTFFGAGVALLGIVQQMSEGSAAGLESFIYGKTASMVSGDTAAIVISALIALVVCQLLFKEFSLLCFDDGFARSQGWPVVLLDLILMALVVTVTVVGLQAVGLILIIALLIIPAAAARFWTERLSLMVVLAALIGGLSAMVGAGMSALYPKLPSGAMIVVAAAVFFTISLFLGQERGVIRRAISRSALNRRVAQQHLLRAIYEALEIRHGGEASSGEKPNGPVSFEHLLKVRSWTPSALQRELTRAERQGLVVQSAEAKQAKLTSVGIERAARFVREHRLWEMYLITHADIAPSHVDRDADTIEHVLSPQMIAQLESLVLAEQSHRSLPASPHDISSYDNGGQHL